MVADPADCSFQFNPVGTAKFTNSCDVAKGALVAGLGGLLAGGCGAGDAGQCPHR